MNFIRSLGKMFIFQATVLKFGDLFGGWKLAKNANFQHNICKIMAARPKKYRDMRCEYDYNNLYEWYFLPAPPS